MKNHPQQTRQKDDLNSTAGQEGIRKNQNGEKLRKVVNNRWKMAKNELNSGKF